MSSQFMQAAVYHGPRDLRVENRPIPAIGPDEALLKVVSAGICGTDLRIWHGDHRKYASGVSRVPGHEVVGDLVEVGVAVKGVPTGQRVFIAPNMGCGHCRQCVSGHYPFYYPTHTIENTLCLVIALYYFIWHNGYNPRLS